MAHMISVYDNKTGETVTREMTVAEEKAYDTMMSEQAADKIAAAAQAAAQAAAKKSAYKKLAALGLTADEIAAL